MRSSSELAEVFSALKLKFKVPIRKGTTRRELGVGFCEAEVNEVFKMMQLWKLQEDIAREALLKERRRRLVKEATPSELAFKSFLEENRFKFEFQKGCKNGTCFFIIDFYFPETKIGVEIDGSSHDGKAKKDQRRTKWLKRNGFISKMLRFKNEDIFSERKRESIRKILMTNVYVPSVEKEAKREIKCPVCLNHFEIEA